MKKKARCQTLPIPDDRKTFPKKDTESNLHYDDVFRI